MEKTLLLSTILLSSVCLADSSGDDAVETLIDLSKELVSVFAAIDGPCGLLNISVEQGWKIDRVKLNHGILQNKFRFSQNKHQPEEYRPKGNEQASVMELRQDSLIPMPYSPIDIQLDISHISSGQSASFDITKGICNSYQSGTVKVVARQSHPPYAFVANPHFVIDRFVDFFDINRLNSFYTPAYVVIPNPQTPDLSLQTDVKIPVPPSQYGHEPVIPNHGTRWNGEY